jgi:rhomboid protease GluP
VPLPREWQWRLDRWRKNLSGMFSASEESGRPRLCPSCGQLVGAGATKCHNCGTNLRFSLTAINRSLSGLLPTENPITYSILFINGVMFVLSILVSMRLTGSAGLNIDGRALLRLGARESHLIFAGEWWRLVMPIFLHGGIFHIFMNTWVLMDLGPQIEEIYGSARYCFLYVVTGIFSFVVSTGWSIYMRDGYGISIGASGAIMGLVGLLLGMTHGRQHIGARMVRQQLIRWVIYIGIFGLLTPTDNAAHFGGLAAGYLFGMIMADRQPVEAGARQRAAWMGWSAAAVVIVSFVFMIFNFLKYNRY